MPELRKDPVDGRWVIISTERARRPGNFIDDRLFNKDSNVRKCQFCQTQENVIYSKGGVKVVPSLENFLSNNEPLHKWEHGLYDIINGYGAHELVIETDKHIANMADLDVDEIENVFLVYCDRFEEFKKDPNFKHIVAYKNYGAVAGSRSIEHARSHIITTPVHPLRVKEKLDGAQEYYESHQKCIYCNMIAQELEDKVRIIHETNHFIAIAPYAAKFLFEVWILPKKHECHYANGIKDCSGDLAKMMKVMLKKLQVGLEDPAYNYVILTSPLHIEHDENHQYPNIKDEFHWHIELMPRLTRLAGFEKGTGFYICSVPPEMTAEFLREVAID